MHFSHEERYYLKLKAAHLYYIENRPLIEIAELLYLSRPTLNKLLSEAREEGIVTISINDIRQGNHHMGLEHRLRKKLSLKDVKIINAASDAQDIINAAIGFSTAKYLASLIKSGMVIGVGWGHTLQTMANHIQPDPAITNVEFVSLLGGLHTQESKTYSTFGNYLCESIAANYPGSSISMLYTPLIAQDDATAKAIKSMDSIASTLERMRALDVAVVGIDGDPQHSTTVALEKSFHAPEVKAELIKKCYVGNICSRFYTLEGELEMLSIEDRVISIYPADLQRTPIAIGAAGGEHKVLSIIGASRAKLFNVLITDARTANNIDEYLGN